VNKAGHALAELNDVFKKIHQKSSVPANYKGAWHERPSHCAVHVYF